MNATTIVIRLFYGRNSNKISWYDNWWKFIDEILFPLWYDLRSSSRRKISKGRKKCCFMYHANRSHGSWSHLPRVLEKLLRIFISWRWEMCNFTIAFRPSFVSCFMDLVILFLLTTNFYLKNLNTCRIEVSISHFRIYDIFKIGWCTLYVMLFLRKANLIGQHHPLVFSCYQLRPTLNQVYPILRRFAIKISKPSHYWQFGCKFSNHWSLESDYMSYHSLIAFDGRQIHWRHAKLFHVMSIRLVFGRK